MGGVIVGGLMVLAAVVVSTWAIVVTMRATSDATARAQVLALKGAALGQGREVPEVTSVYDPPAELPPVEPMRRVAPARRLRAVEPPPAPGVILPGEAAPAPERRPFGGW